MKRLAFWSKAHSPQRGHKRYRPLLGGIERLEDRTMLNAGGLDLTFGTGGIKIADVSTLGNNDSAADVAVLADGSVIAVGFSRAGTDPFAPRQFAVSRFRSDGTIDPSFGTGGSTRFSLNATDDFTAEAVAVQPDGKIVVVGGASRLGSSGAKMVIARLEAGGTPDTTFGTDFDGNGTPDGIRTFSLDPTGSGNDYARDVVIQNGKILIAGTSAVPGTGQFVLTVVQLKTSDGSLDASFNGTGSSTIAGVDLGGNPLYFLEATSLAVGSDGKIVIGGQDGFESGQAHVLGRFNSDGTIDAGFDGDGFLLLGYAAPAYLSGVSDVKVLPDGSILAVGNAFDENGAGRLFTALRLRGLDGAIDPTFGTGGLFTLGIPGFGGPNGGGSYSTSLAVQPDGKVVIGGYATSLRDATFPFVAAATRITASGQLDTNFGDGGYTTINVGPAPFQERINAVALQPSNGNIVLVGETQEDLSAITGDTVLIRLVGTSDAVPPVVTTTSFLPSGTLQSGETSLAVYFSEPVLNANLPASYALQRAGGDGLLGTGDDINIPIADSIVVTGTQATLDFDPLSVDKYRLTVRDTITDLALNHLDGNFDGIAGGNWSHDFVVTDTFTLLAETNSPKEAEVDGPRLTVTDISPNGRSNRMTVAIDNRGVLSVTDDTEQFQTQPAGWTLSPDRRSISIELHRFTRGTIDLRTRGGSDLVTVVMGRIPLPAGGLVIDGGVGVSDEVRFAGDPQSRVSYIFSSSDAGFVDVNGIGRIQYSGIEYVTDDVSYETVVIPLPDAGVTIAKLRLFTFEGLLELETRDSQRLSPLVSFRPPSKLLSIVTHNDFNEVELGGTGIGWPSEIQIGQPRARMGNVSFTGGSLRLAKHQAFSVFAENFATRDANVRQTIATSGTGAIRIDTIDQIRLGENTTLESENGQIALVAGNTITLQEALLQSKQGAIRFVSVHDKVVLGSTTVQTTTGNITLFSTSGIGLSHVETLSQRGDIQVITRSPKFGVTAGAWSASTSGKISVIADSLAVYSYGLELYQTQLQAGGDLLISGTGERGVLINESTVDGGSVSINGSGLNESPFARGVHIVVSKIISAGDVSIWGFATRSVNHDLLGAFHAIGLELSGVEILARGKLELSGTANTNLRVGGVNLQDRTLIPKAIEFNGFATTLYSATQRVYLTGIPLGPLGGEIAVYASVKSLGSDVRLSTGPGGLSVLSREKRQSTRLFDYDYDFDLRGGRTAMGDLTFVNGSRLNIALGRYNAGTQQLRVAGRVRLQGLNLVLTRHYNSGGTDPTLTIMSANAIVGTFNGIRDGAIVKASADGFLLPPTNSTNRNRVNYEIYSIAGFVTVTPLDDRK